MRSNAVLVRNDAQTDGAVEVRDDGRFKGVFARESITEGSVIFQLRGTISTSPSKYTIQVGWRRHLNLPKRKPKDARDYDWQYLNHHCSPNGYIDTTELTFRALREIEAGEEITFNYLTTESDMAVPFECTCGSTNCYGLIRGRDFLTPEQADHLAREIGEDHIVSLLMPGR